MGISSDGILAYGYDLPEGIENDLPWYDDELGRFGEQLEDKLLKELAGFTEIYKPNNDYWKRRHEAEDKLKVKLVYHCSYEYPMYILAAKDSVVHAFRGYPDNVGDLVTKDVTQWAADVNVAMNMLGLKGDGPSWFLAAIMG